MKAIKIKTMTQNRLNLNFLIAASIFLAIGLFSPFAHAAADIEINTPAVSAIKNSMQARHTQLEPFYASGAVGLTRDGLVSVRDANAVSLSQRQSVNGLVSAENADRNALYKEIANGNGHPEWEAEVRATFAQRWAQKAPAGWWVEGANGWVKK
jgi:uncharacterized protein YdbL (DUF1318 family)